MRSVLKWFKATLRGSSGEIRLRFLRLLTVGDWGLLLVRLDRVRCPECGCMNSIVGACPGCEARRLP